VQNKTKTGALDSKLQGSQRGTEDHDKRVWFQRKIDVKTPDEHKTRENSTV
jgi:hypothetical protein